MKLPTHIISQVKWFEHYFEHRSCHGLASRIVLHFKPWWRPSKTIWVNGAVTNETADAIYKDVHPEAKELLAQLKVQCPDQA